MSASSGGYFVQDKDGKFFHTTDVIETEDQPEEGGHGGAGAEGGGPGKKSTEKDYVQKASWARRPRVGSRPDGFGDGMSGSGEAHDGGGMASR